MPLNPGKRPEEARGKRVAVLLHGGYSTTEKEPLGWPADGCKWEISDPPHPYQIKRYKIL